MVTVLIKNGSGGWSPAKYDSIDSIHPHTEWKPVEGNELLTKNIEPPKHTIEETIALRKSAYFTESDPLYLSAVYSAIKNDTGADLTDWVAKVDEIKQRYPK